MSPAELNKLPFTTRHRWLSRVSALGLPERYQTATLDGSHLKHTELVGKGAVITGTPGCGKTTLMAALARRTVALDLDKRCPPERGFARFVSISDLLARFRKGFGNSDQEEAVFNELSMCQWLYIDDLGTEQSTDWSFSCLHRLIDSRWANQLGTVVTTNLPLVELNNWSERITSRLLDGAAVLEMESKDWRLAK